MSDFNTDAESLRLFREDLETSGHSSLEKRFLVFAKAGSDQMADDMVEFVRQKRIKFFGAVMDNLPPGQDCNIRVDVKQVPTGVSTLFNPYGSDYVKIILRIEACSDNEVWQELKPRRDRYTSSRLEWSRFAALDDALIPIHMEDD